MKLRAWARCAMVVGLILGATTAEAENHEREALFVIGQSATVRAEQHVESAIVIGGDLTIAGTVHGIAAAVGGDLIVAPGADIEGPAAAIGGELELADQARVAGPKVHVAGGDFGAVAKQLSAARAPEPPPFWLGSLIRSVQVLVVFVFGLFLSLWFLSPRATR
jgi:hypothetical protein